MPTLSEPTKSPSSFRLRDKEKLLAIEEALEKIREGTYGVCEECGDEIGAGPIESNALGQVCASPVNRDWKRKRPIRNLPKGSLTNP